MTMIRYGALTESYNASMVPDYVGTEEYFQNHRQNDAQKIS